MDYYTSATTKSKLTIAAAYSRLRVNAAGTAPEWGGATPRVFKTTSSSTASPNANTTDMYILTAQAAAAAFVAPSGTPVEGQPLKMRVIATAAWALSWDAIYRPISAALPLITVTNKLLYLVWIYNLTDTKWDLVTKIQEP